LVVFGGEPRAYIEGYSFTIEDNFASFSGSFTSVNSAIGVLEISCEAGLSTTWKAQKGVQAVRTPSVEDFAKIPAMKIDEDLYSRADGSDNFDEYTGVVASSDDWFLVRNYSESLIPIPSGWTSISTPDGGYFLFSRSGRDEDYSVEIHVGRDCTEVETVEELFESFEENISGESGIEILKKENIDLRKGYFVLSIETEVPSTFIRMLIASKPSKGCFFYLSAGSDLSEWKDFYPIIQASVEHWYDLANNFIGMDLPDDVLE
jgi:hypothetical protein